MTSSQSPPVKPVNEPWRVMHAVRWAITGQPSAWLKLTWAREAALRGAAGVAGRG